METGFQLLANSYISNLTPYQPGKPIEELERELGITAAIKLASNENVLGASPKAIAAAQAVLLHSHIYPDGACFTLKQTLANFLQVQPQQLTIGNGSENVLEIIVKTYLSPGDKAMLSEYAFLTIGLLIKSHGAHIVTAPAIQYKHSIGNMVTRLTPDTRIIFLVNPNNPTGTYFTATDLAQLLEAIPSEVLVVIDEAYLEYINAADFPDTLQLLAHYPNIVITRTFSKAYGLAALRIGYAISSPEIADMLNRARLPFNVNSIAAAAANAALGDQDHIIRSAQLNTAGMQQMENGLRQLKLNYIPSVGNFIAVDVRQHAGTIYQKLLRDGIIVRPLTAYNMPTHLRITISTPEHNDRCLHALKHVLKN